MAENTRTKDLQTEVKHHAEDLRHLSLTVEKLKAALAVQSKSQDTKMDRIQLVLQQVLENVSQPLGSSSNSGSVLKHIPFNVAPLVKDISLGFPHFDGSTPVLEWIFKADKFFSYHNTPNSDRFEIASMYFKKEVVLWFQMLHKLEAVTTWNALTHALESQFSPSPFDYPMSNLFKLQQDGSVSTYYLKFMVLANRSKGLSEKVVLNYFISGLLVEIRRDIVAMTLTTLLHVVALTKLYEEKYSTPPKSSTSYSTRFTTSSSYSTPYNPLPQHNTKPSIIAPKSPLPPLLPRQLVRNSNPPLSRR